MQGWWQSVAFEPHRYRLRCAAPVRSDPATIPVVHPSSVPEIHRSRRSFIKCVNKRRCIPQCYASYVLKSVSGHYSHPSVAKNATANASLVASIPRLGSPGPPGTDRQILARREQSSAVIFSANLAAWPQTHTYYSVCTVHPRDNPVSASLTPGPWVPQEPVALTTGDFCWGLGGVCPVFFGWMPS